MVETLEQRRTRLVNKGWIGVDFDGTLAYYDRWVGWNKFGAPIPAMVERVQAWLVQGQEVRIFTARVGVAPDHENQCLVTGETFTNEMMADAIKAWCLEHIGCELTVTCVKDVFMIELWDDRAVQVVPNTGRTLAEEHEAQVSALHGAP